METHPQFRFGTSLILGALCLTASPALANDPAIESPLAFPVQPEATPETGWSYEAGEGLTFTPAEGDKSVTIGGRLMYDFAWMSADDGPKAGAAASGQNAFIDGGEVRRAWLEAKGELYDKIYFAAQYEFASTNPSVRDLYLGIHDVFGSVDAQFGQYKEPFSMDELTSSKYITFMERSMSTALAPAWNAGAMLKDAYSESRFAWAVGVFRETDSQGDSPQQKDGAYNVTGRVHWAPVHDDEATSVVHVGLAASMRTPESGTARVRTRPENHLAPYVLDTRNGGTDLMTDGISLYGAEFAWVGGPWSAQAEYVMQSIDGVGGPDVDSTSYYGFVSYFITGEHRPYSYKSGTFGRVKPQENYGQGGNGAWEVAARYSNFDIDAPMAVSPLAGTVDDITLGVNWYMNPNARVMFNYVFGDLDSNTDANDGNMNMFMMRFQVDF